MAELALSKSVKELNFSVIREMSLLASGYEGVINLGIGEPDFVTPAEIIEKAFADVRDGHTHYTASQGDPQLLKKLAKKISLDNHLTISSENILITHGGMGALAAALRCTIDPGEQALVLEPHFPDYAAHIKLAGGVAVGVSSCFEEGFVPRPEVIAEAITPLTKVIILNSPNNPTGGVLQGGILDRIAEIAVNNDLIVISDEVYDEIVFSHPFESISTREGMAERTLVIKSFSKSYAMTGWRVGYCYGPQALIKEMIKVVNYSTACVSSIGQRAALAALEIDPLIVSRMREKYVERASLVCEQINSFPGIRALEPKGSFYVFVDISGITGDSRKFALDLLEQARVVVVPGYAFGKSGEGCIRIACTKDEGILSEALNRLKEYLETLQKVAVSK